MHLIVSCLSLSLPVGLPLFGDWFVDIAAPTCSMGTGTQLDPFCNINDALAVAADGDTIHVASGTYGERLNIDASVVIRGTAGRAVTVVDAMGVNRVVRVRPSVSVEIDGLTLRGGLSTFGRGGGVLNEGTLTLRNSTVTGNEVTNAVSTYNPGGGGIYSSPGSELALIGCEISSNQAGSVSGLLRGGGLRAQCANSVVIRDSIITNNTVRSLFYAATSGGGIAVDGGTLTMQNSTVSQNTAESASGGVAGGGFAGGIFAYVDGPIEIHDSRVLGNTARNTSGVAGYAGAAYLMSYSEEIEIKRCEINGNTAGDTVGLFAPSGRFEDTVISGNHSPVFVDVESAALRGSNIQLLRCTIADNESHGVRVFSTVRLANSTLSGNSGVGLLFTGGGAGASLEIENSTVVENRAFDPNGAGYAGGVAVSSFSSIGTLTVRNSVVADNTPTPGGPADVSLNGVTTSFASLGNNLIGEADPSTGFVDGVNGDIVGVPGAPIDPLLEPLADNGGITETHALQAGSLAVDAGNATTFEATDQRGLPRPAGATDIGAYERAPSGTVPGCVASPNSTGMVGRLGSLGTTDIGINDYELVATMLPPNSFGFFLSARSLRVPFMPPGSQGSLCLGSDVGRVVGGQVLITDGVGSMSILANLSAVPTATGPVAVQPGDTWLFQAWHRDAVGGTPVSNFSETLATTFE